MTKEQKQCRAGVVQGLINKAKEEVYNGFLTLLCIIQD